MSDRRSWFKRIFKLDYDEKFDGALELIQLQEYELDRTATLAERTNDRVDGLQEAVKVTVRRVDDIESKIDAIRDFDFGGRRMLAQFDVESALAGETAIRVQLDNVNHEARLRYGSVDVVDTIDAVWFISKTGVPIDNDFGDVLHPNAQRRDVIEFLKVTSDLQGNVPLPGDGSADIADLDARLNQEIKDREQGDSAVADALAQEVSDRTDGDQALQDQIDLIPAPTPPYDDTAIKDGLAQEVQDREDADTALDKKIDAHLSGHGTGGNFMPVSGGEFTGPILGPVIDSVSTDPLSLGTLKPWDDSIPAAGQLFVSSTFPDAPDLVLKFNLGANINHLAGRSDLYYILVTSNGQQIWTCSSGGTALDATTLKVVPDKVEGEVLSPSGDIFLFVSGSDGYPYTTSVTVDRMINSYLTQLPGVDQAELDKKVNKAGDSLTGNLDLRPEFPKRWITFKNFPPVDPNTGQNDSSDSFGTEFNIDALNSGKSRFRVMNRTGPIFDISGGVHPAVHLGPVENGGVQQGVPLHLSKDPTADDEAVHKKYVDDLIQNIAADSDLDWTDFGNYRFRVGQNVQVTGGLKCEDPPSGVPAAKDVKQFRIHKTNKDGVTHNLAASWEAGHVLQLSSSLGVAYYAIENTLPGDANNKVLVVRWVRGDEAMTLPSESEWKVEEGEVRGNYAHLNSANVFTKDNTFDGGVSTFRRPGGYGYKDFMIKGHTGDGSTLDNNLLEVHRNEVDSAHMDAINYHGKMESGPNIVNVARSQEIAQKKVDALKVELEDQIANAPVPRFYSFDQRIDTVFIRDKDNFPGLVQPSSYFMCTSQLGNDYGNDWPGNATFLLIKINNELINGDLATGMGNFLIRDNSSNVMLAGMVNAYVGKVTLSGRPYEKFHIEKWVASGSKWIEHEHYKIALSGTHWEPRT